MAEIIHEKEVLKQFQEDTVIYSIEVNRKRIVPDVRDGLKRVQRRILDSMYNQLPCETSPVKTAEVVGNVIGRSHPHGDSSVADAIKTLSNWFDCKIPLIKSDTNMGSMQGDPAAHMRYTEVMLSDFSKECILADLKESKDIVDWTITYNNRSKEPEYLPVKVPLLLINGCTGIGIGMKTGIPKHNIGEVIDATLNLIKNPKAQVVLVPDQCMECDIVDTNWKSISNKGKGTFIVRARIDIETIKDYPYLIIKSTPDGVYFDKGNSSKGGVKYKILDMVKEGKLPQVLDIEEHSHDDQMRIGIKLRKGSDPNYVRDILYKSTQLQDTFQVNFEVLDGYTPIPLSYKAYLQLFIEQRKMTKFRLYCSLLQKYKTKYHEKEMFVKVMESGYMDEIISMIEKQTTTDDSKLIEFIVKKVKITDLQAKFIINSNLKRLSKAYLKSYKEDLKAYKEKVDLYEAKITNEDLLIQDIVDELKLYKEKYNQPRKCRIISKDSITHIPEGTFNIVVTENNYIKKLPVTEHITTYKGDNPKHVLENLQNTESIILFSKQGKVYKMPIHKIPISEKNSTGQDIRILLKGLTSDIIAVLYEPHLKMAANDVVKTYIVVVTNNNCIKKLDIGDFLTVPPSGIIYTKLNDGDYVKEVAAIPDNLDIVLYSDRRALRCPMEKIPNYRRSTLGVSAMALKSGEVIDGMSIIYPNTTDIVVVTQSGRVNKFNISGMPVSDRYKAGNSVIRLGKTDKIVSIFSVNDNNVITIYTKLGKVDLPVKDIAPASSVSSGVKVLSGKTDFVIKAQITQ